MRKDFNHFSYNESMLRMRGVSIAVILLCLFIFTACVDIDVLTRIDRSGSGSQTWTFSTTALLSRQLRSQVENSPLFKKKDVQITDEYKEGDYILTVRMPFTKVEELNDSTRELKFEESGFFVNRFTFSEKWKRDLGAAGLLAEKTRSLAPVKMTVSVELPGEIIEANANDYKGSVARWVIPINDLATSLTMNAVSSSWNFYAIVPCLVAFFAVIGVLIYRVRSYFHKTPTTPRCASCGAMVPPGSSFCNSCGTKLS